jgi:leucine dehydrogenase
MGGGKAVIIGDPAKDKTRNLFLSMGELIESLDGTYLAAKDSGILPEDLDIVAEKTCHVTGTTKKQGGSGDPSLATAKGVLAGMQAACQFVFGTKSLKGRVVAIQGIGQVGWNVGNLLLQKGAKLFVADPLSSRVKRARQSWKASVVPLSRIHQVPADIFAPCALGGILNADTIPHLRANIVAGGANNQFLDEEQDPFRLMKRNILHVPDYVLNAGGLIHLFVREILHQRRVAPWILNIERTVHQVLAASLQKQLPPLVWPTAWLSKNSSFIEEPLILIPGRLELRPHSTMNLPSRKSVSITHPCGPGECLILPIMGVWLGCGVWTGNPVWSIFVRFGKNRAA